MPYIKPDEVVSPKAHWKLIRVLKDGGPGEIAYALGEWDGVPRIGMRWNGMEDSEIGNPQSRGLPTWTMLDSDIYLAIIQKLSERDQVVACSLLGIELPPMVEIMIDHHPSGRFTLKKRPSGQSMFKDVMKDGLFGEEKAHEFVQAAYNEIKNHLDNGTRVILGEFPYYWRDDRDLREDDGRS